MNEIFTLRFDIKNNEIYFWTIIKNKENAPERIANVNSTVNNIKEINWAITLNINPNLIGNI